ncbi:MAG: hypothetical protein COT17_04870 [Elusimicrobia bacterium CG08_land_8_20_14_0_20_51_18]|nr:MAG: hypothetical protein COT17_04870 [Elusimicrobia bacterium CG08_land_8_20_14_0_20_51_18]
MEFNRQSLKSKSQIKRITAALAAALVSSLIRPPAAVSAASPSEAEVQSAYIYNFIPLISWPERNAAASSGSVKICHVGEGPLAGELSGLTGRQAGGRVIRVSSAAVAGESLSSCDIVMLSPSVREQIPVILKKLEGSAILTVSPIPQFARKGGVVGFVTEKGRVRIEISLGALKKTGLKVSAKLMEVARLLK